MPRPYDSRLIFGKTAAGSAAVGERLVQMSAPARRLLLVMDGKRQLADLPAFTRPGEVDDAIEELEALGLIVLVGIASEPSAAERAARARRDAATLALLKPMLAGAVHRELGADGVVLGERVRDCVNLDVLRRLMRECFDAVLRAHGHEAARRLVKDVKPLLDAHRDSQ